MENSNVTVLLSGPRTGSNVIAKLLGMAADAKSRLLPKDSAHGVSLAEHFQSVMGDIPASGGNASTALFKGHGAYLTEEQFRELPGLTDHLLIVQRDPLLVLESMLRKLLFADEGVGKQSRVDTEIREALTHPATRQSLLDRLEIKGDVRSRVEACGDNKSAAAALILDSCARQQEFDSWPLMQEHMKATRDYQLAGTLLQALYPDSGMKVTDYPDRHQFFDKAPFSFIRSCTDVSDRFMQEYGTDKVSIVDATAIRASRTELDRAAKSVGLDPNLIASEGWQPSTSTAPRTDAEAVFMGRIQASTQLDKPFEQPLLPSQVPAFMKNEDGLLWDMVDRYTLYAHSPAYVGPRTKEELSPLLDSIVVQEDERSVTLMKRNPVFAYVAVTSSPQLDHNTKRIMKSRIREALPDYAEAFDRVDAITLTCNQSKVRPHTKEAPAWER